MTDLRRGFKTEANAIARDVRIDLELGVADALDPWKLAGLLGIPLIPLRDFRREAPAAVRHFGTVEQGAFSAMTVFHGRRRMVVYNDSHSRGRQASDIAHELAHALLQHPPTSALGRGGCRNWNAEFEAEADWLGAALLISDDAALRIVMNDMGIREAAEYYGTGVKMVNFRLNVTGARRRAERIRSKGGSWGSSQRKHQP